MYVQNFFLEISVSLMSLQKWDKDNLSQIIYHSSLSQKRP